MSQLPPEEVQLPQLIDGTLDQWLDVLPRYQKAHLVLMIERESPSRAAMQWLDNIGARDTAPYGGVRSVGAKLYTNLLKEFQKLLCGSELYNEERRELKKYSSAGRTTIVSALSVMMAQHLGASAEYIIPPIALTLAVLSTATKNTLCEQLEEMIAESEMAVSDSQE